MNKVELVARYTPHYSLINTINKAYETPVLLLTSLSCFNSVPAPQFLLIPHMKRAAHQTKPALQV